MTSTPSSKRAWFRFAGAALLILGITSTVTQLIGWQTLAPDRALAPGEEGWSTGGLFALLGAIYMGTSCQSWDDFKRRIWIPVGVVAVLAFGGMYLVASSPSTSAAEPSPGSRALSKPPRDEAPSENAVRKRVARLVRDELSALDESEWKGLFLDARDAGKSEAFVASKLEQDYRSGNMREQQFCVLRHWLADLRGGGSGRFADSDGWEKYTQSGRTDGWEKYTQSDRAAIVSECTDWILVEYYRDFIAE